MTNKTRNSKKLSNIRSIKNLIKINNKYLIQKNWRRYGSLQLTFITSESIFAYDYKEEKEFLFDFEIAQASSFFYFWN